LFSFLTSTLLAADSPRPATTLRVAIAQIGVVRRADDNLAKVLQYIEKAASEKCRLVVFPEGALRDLAAPDDPETVAKLQAISQAAARHKIYVMLGVFSHPPSDRRGSNWMVVFDPTGSEVFRYTKLYDRRDGRPPGVFLIDGIPCSAIICADRWLRTVEELPIMDGAQISFELSDNFGSEWVSELEWYWYVGRARRNNVWVVFANTAAAPPEETDRHGHSAVVDPAGSIVAASRDEHEQMVVADLEVSRATRTEAERRRNHPAFRQFWETARLVRDRQCVDIPSWQRYASSAVEVTVAAAQMDVTNDRGRNVSRMEKLIREAATRHADVVVFPELAVTGSGSDQVSRTRSSDLMKTVRKIEKAAKKHGVYVIFGMPGYWRHERRNSAYVIGPQGKILTRYDQMVVDRPELFQPGSCPAQAWFQIKGVPALVTIGGGELLWSEISEMAAFAGAQLLFNLSATEPDSAIAADFASFRTFTAIVQPSGSGGSTIWDDLAGADEIRAAVSHATLPQHATLPIETAFAANCVAKAGKGEEIIYATRKVNTENTFREDTINPPMKPWYDFGARVITGCWEK